VLRTGHDHAHAEDANDFQEGSGDARALDEVAEALGGGLQVARQVAFELDGAGDVGVFSDDVGVPGEKRVESEGSALSVVVGAQHNAVGSPSQYVHLVTSKLGIIVFCRRLALPRWLLESGWYSQDIFDGDHKRERPDND
jgi:hypothetical protein